MKLFDSAADMLFREDSSGRTLFYPWSIYGPGFITETDETRRDFRAFYQNFSIAMIVAIIGFQAVSGMLITVATVLPVFIVWYYVAIRRMVDTLHRSPEKTGLVRYYENAARTKSWPVLIALQLATLGLTAGALWSLQQEDAKLVNLLAVGMLALGVIAVGLLMVAKWKLERTETD